MRSTRRFSQAISEGDGISLLADVAEPGAAEAAEADGAEGIVLRRELAGVRESTELPILWYAEGPFERARDAGADACLVAADEYEGNEGALERRYAEAAALGLDCVVAVGDEDELQLALDRLDPEILLLSARGASGPDGLERVLGLLPDVPAGKLAVAELELGGRADVAELERAGVDAVIVRSADVARLRSELTTEG